MNVSKKGLKLIKEFEGLRLKAYKDGGGVWTIGYGHTGLVNGGNIKEGLTITEEDATRLLIDDVQKFEKHVNTYVQQYRLTQNEFDALVSFAFNIGSLTQLSAKRTRTKEEISRKMVEYSNMTINGKLTFVKGLHIRRLKETLYFLGQL